jgi:dihydroorotate dehydrogenase (fumarate)
MGVMNLSSSYAGLNLRSPIVVGSCPLTLEPDRVGDLVEMGAGAVVMPSIFEEQISRDQFGFAADPIRSSSGESLPGSDPDWDGYNGGTENYLRSIECVKALGLVPVIASINCISTEGWSEYVRRLESAGADAIELNLFHYEIDPDRFAEDVERELLARIQYVLDATRLPLSVKLVPSFTCLANFTCRIAGTGAKSVCLFGQAPVFEPRRVLDDDSLENHWRLTNHSDLRVVLDAIHQVRTTVPGLTIAASGGIRNAIDAIAAIQLGADVVMLTSALYREGVAVIHDIYVAIEKELDKRKCKEFSGIVGSKLTGFDAFPVRTRREQYATSVTNRSLE